MSARGAGGLLSLLAAAAFLFAARAAAVTVERIVAKVNDEIITLSEVQEAGREEIMALRMKYRGAELKRRIEQVERRKLQELIERALTLQRAKELKITVGDKDVESAIELVKRRNKLNQAQFLEQLRREGMTLDQYRARIRKTILVSRVGAREVNSRVVVSSDEVAAYYREHLEEFLQGETRRAWHIFFAVDPGASSAEVRAKARKADHVYQLLRGGGNFEQLARRYSEGPARSKGGDLGFVKRGEVYPEFEKALFSLARGAFSSPVRTRAGFHIIQAAEIRPGRPIPLEKLEKDIRAKIQKLKRRERYRQWMAELREQAFVEVTYEGDAAGRSALSSIRVGFGRGGEQGTSATYYIRELRLLGKFDTFGREQLLWALGTSKKVTRWEMEERVRAGADRRVTREEVGRLKRKYWEFVDPEAVYNLYFYEYDRWLRDDDLGTLRLADVIRAFEARPDARSLPFRTDNGALEVLIEVRRAPTRRILSEGLAPGR
ncbi:MAG: peptidylprolyl isomerase [Nitrospinota bacterium]